MIQIAGEGYNYDSQESAILQAALGNAYGILGSKDHSRIISSAPGIFGSSADYAQLETLVGD